MIPYERSYTSCTGMCTGILFLVKWWTDLILFQLNLYAGILCGLLLPQWFGTEQNHEWILINQMKKPTHWWHFSSKAHLNNDPLCNSSWCSSKNSENMTFSQNGHFFVSFMISRWRDPLRCSEEMKHIDWNISLIWLPRKETPTICIRHQSQLCGELLQSCRVEYWADRLLDPFSAEIISGIWTTWLSRNALA